MISENLMERGWTSSGQTCNDFSFLSNTQQRALLTKFFLLLIRDVFFGVDELACWWHSLIAGNVGRRR
jgi:hypothetical protein